MQHSTAGATRRAPGRAMQRDPHPYREGHPHGEIHPHGRLKAIFEGMKFYNNQSRAKLGYLSVTQRVILYR